MVVHAALEAGVTLIDTADADHRDAHELGHNESLIAGALDSFGGDTSQVLVATKGGHLRPGDGSWTLNGSPEHLKQACDAPLKRLGAEAIGLYQFHRPDPAVPYAESVGAVRELLDEGEIRFAGISQADRDQIREANTVLGGRLVSVQNQFSPAFRSSEPELELCAELGIGFLPWSPFGGIRKAGELGSRFAVFAAVAEERGQPAPGLPGLDAGQGARGDPDTGCLPPGDRTFGRSGRTAADRGGAEPVGCHAAGRFLTAGRARAIHSPGRPGLRGAASTSPAEPPGKSRAGRAKGRARRFARTAGHGWNRWS